MDPTGFAEQVGTTGAVTITGLSTRGGPVAGVRRVIAPSGIESIQADEMIVRCGAATGVAELDAALGEVGQSIALPLCGTVGGALAVGHSDIRRLGYGPVRNTLLQARYVSAKGDVVKAGGPTVKNVSGFDLCRLLVGSCGTLGFLGEVILRTRPRPATSQWFARASEEPLAVFAALYRPVSVLWDGATIFVLLEGHPADVREQAAAARLDEAPGPPQLPVGRSSLSPSAITSLTGRFVAEVGVGIVHGDAPRRPPLESGVAAVGARVKHELDPTGRLNPGVVVG
ncbi:MAG: FAD-binding protein [Ilumatobacteraceae bacterium]